MNDLYTLPDQWDILGELLEEKGFAHRTPRGIRFIDVGADMFNVEKTIEHYKNGGMVYEVPFEMVDPHWTRLLKNWIREVVWNFDHNDKVPNFLKYKISVPLDWACYPSTRIWVNNKHQIVEIEKVIHW